MKSEDAFDRLVLQFRLWEKFEKAQTKWGRGIEWARFQIDLPVELLRMLDAEADKRGIPRQSLVKVILWQWLHDQK